MTGHQVAIGATQVREPAKKARSLRVKVVDNTKDGRPVVDVTLPTGLVRFGMKMARRFSPELKDANLDWDAISGLIEEGASGQIVHVEDATEHKTIEVWVE